MAVETSKINRMVKKKAKILIKRVLSLIAPTHPKRATKKIITPIAIAKKAGLK